MVNLNTSEILKLSDLISAATSYVFGSVLGQGKLNERAAAAVIISALARFFAGAMPTIQGTDKQPVLSDMTKNMVTVAVLNAVYASMYKTSVPKQVLIGLASDSVAERALENLGIQDSVLVGTTS